MKFTLNCKLKTKSVLKFINNKKNIIKLIPQKPGFVDKLTQDRAQRHEENENLFPSSPRKVIKPPSWRAGTRPLLTPVRRLSCENDRLYSSTICNCRVERKCLPRLFSAV